MKDNIQPCEVIESNLLDPTKETETEFAEIKQPEHQLMDLYVCNLRDRMVLSRSQITHMAKY